MRDKIVKQFPDIFIKIYSSDTPKKIKDLHFSNVNKYFICDVLIYTPTISAGISFEVDHFDFLFGYFV